MSEQTMIRIDKETREALKDLKYDFRVDSMGKVVKALVKAYKDSKKD